MGKNKILFVYPKNNTPSCTREKEDFNHKINNFRKLNIEVFGVSKDSILSHDKVINKRSLGFELLSDEKTIFIDTIGAWVEKKMYGKTYFGTERTTLFIGKENEVIKVWNKVKVSNHVNEVLDFCENHLGVT